MPIPVECDECGSSFSLADKFAGKTVRCPECSESIQIGRAIAGGSRPARPGSSREETGSEPNRGSSSKARPVRPSRPSRPERPTSAANREKTSKGRSSSNIIMIAGGATIVVLLGVIGFLVVRKSAPVPASPKQVIVKDKASNLSEQLSAVAKQDQAEKEAAAKHLADLEAQARAKATANRPFATDRESSLAKAGSSPTTAEPKKPATVISNSLAVLGDRVAWLRPDGTGFAKKDHMWVYNGDAASLGIAGEEAEPIKLAFYETLRTASIIELFNQEHYLRVRLKPAEFVSYDLPKQTSRTTTGGAMKDSTEQAVWTLSFPLPETRYRRTAIGGKEDDPGRIPNLISRVETQVARMDVMTAEGSTTGSGFLVDESGRVVTNYHLIEDCTSIRAAFKNAGPEGGEVMTPVIGFLHVDPKRDIAVIQVVLPEDFAVRGLPLAKETRKGDEVFAFGSPLRFNSTPAPGVISGYRSAKDFGTKQFAGHWLETTVPISPGNNGGPLVNRYGEVVAINTMTLRGDQQLNFGISAGDIKEAIEASNPGPEELRPAAVPIAAHRADPIDPAEPTESDAQPRRTGQVTIRGGLRLFQLWPIEGTPESATHLAGLDNVVLNVAYRDEAVKTSIEEAARTAVQGVGMDVGGDKGPTLLLVPEVEQSTRSTSQLTLFAHLYVVSEGETLRIWQGSIDLGRMSSAQLHKGSLGSKMKAKIDSFFGELKTSVEQARRSIREAEAKSATEKDPKGSQ